MSPVEQQWLIDYLDNGGSLYIEGVNVALSLRGSDLIDYLGADYVSKTNQLNSLIGQEGTFVQDLQFAYQGGSTTKNNVNELTANGGELLFICEQGKGRIIANADGNYRSICSSVILGAFADGEGNNTKAYLMKQYLEFLESR